MQHAAWIVVVLLIACAVREAYWTRALHRLKTENELLQNSFKQLVAVQSPPTPNAAAIPLPAADLKLPPCHANRSVAYVVASLTHRDGTNFVDAMAKALPGLHVLRAVNGFNQTETIEALLDSGLKFHNLSHNVRKWGKLATFLTKWRALELQLARGSPFQITLEDDVVIKPTFNEFVQRACERLREKQPDVLILSPYSEVLMTSLAGARNLMRQMRQAGIRKNDDHQIVDTRIMGHAMATFRPFLFKKREPKPWKQGRRTNRGDIQSSQGMTWTEMALLRLVTNPAARSLRGFGGLWAPPPLACCYCDATSNVTTRGTTEKPADRNPCKPA